MSGTYCGHCGQSCSTGAERARGHDECRRRLALEPPRFCDRCRRRMKVQVAPRGWTAVCVEHGERTG